MCGADGAKGRGVLYQETSEALPEKSRRIKPGRPLPHVIKYWLFRAVFGSEMEAAGRWVNSAQVVQYRQIHRPREGGSRHEIAWLPCESCRQFQTALEMRGRGASYRNTQAEWALAVASVWVLKVPS
jgi:hypothetical protein